MHTSVIDLYERLSNAPDDRARAKIIAEAFDELESRYPNLGDMATERSLSETELRLKLEIEQVRADLSKEIEQVRADLSKEIEQVRADLSKDIELVRTDLTKEIEHVRADLSKNIEKIRAEILSSKVDVLKWSFAFWFANFSATLLIIWRLFGSSAT